MKRLILLLAVVVLLVSCGCHSKRDAAFWGGLTGGLLNNYGGGYGYYDGGYGGCWNCTPSYSPVYRKGGFCEHIVPIPGFDPWGNWRPDGKGYFKETYPCQ